MDLSYHPKLCNKSQHAPFNKTKPILILVSLILLQQSSQQGLSANRGADMEKQLLRTVEGSEEKVSSLESVFRSTSNTLQGAPSFGEPVANTRNFP